MKENELIEHDGFYYRATPSTNLCVGCDLFDTNLQVHQHCKAPHMDCRGMILKKEIADYPDDQFNYDLEFITTTQIIAIFLSIVIMFIVVAAAITGIGWLLYQFATHLSEISRYLPYTPIAVLGIIYLAYLISKIKK